MCTCTSCTIGISSNTVSLYMCIHTHSFSQMMFHLPYKAVGRDWYLIYSTFKHGISLRTLYRNMMLFENEDSPILLIVRDEQKKVIKDSQISYYIVPRYPAVLSLASVNP